MQVVQPKPTRLNRSASSDAVSPALSRYCVTARLPGAKLVLTHGGVDRPRATAFLARSAAPTMTPGFEVFVQLVIAAIPTEPEPNGKVVPATSTSMVG